MSIKYGAKEAKATIDLNPPKMVPTTVAVEKPVVVPPPDKSKKMIFQLPLREPVEEKPFIPKITNVVAAPPMKAMITKDHAPPPAIPNLKLSLPL